ncbi:MAG: hypothetical protein WCC60_12745 [Ilumatobacteraceae bacterium]
MRKLHKGLLIGGVTLAVLVPAGLVAADQIDMGNGNGHGHGRGNGSMTNECSGDQTQDRVQARDGTGADHAANSAGKATAGTGAEHRSGPADGSGPQADRPMDGTGNQYRSGR